MMEKFVERVNGVLFNPTESWSVIKSEETSVAQIFKEYLAILAVIPVIAGFLGSIFKGSNFFTSLVWGVLFYALTLAGVWIAVKIIKFLAINLKISHDELSIYKLVTYSYTPILLAGIFFIIPPLFWLCIVGFYGFYLLSLGLPHLLECSKEEQFNLTIISILVILLILILVYSLSGLISGMKVPYLKVY